MAARKTSFSDVCGTMDELKRLLHEEHERVVAGPVELIEPLLDDARYMLDRMRHRLETYRGFRARFRARNRSRRYTDRRVTRRRVR